MILRINKFIIILIILAGLSLSGCAIHYKDLDHGEQTVSNHTKIDKITYRIKDLPFFASDGGLEAIADSFDESNVATSLERHYGEDIPDEGIYIFIEPMYKVPSAAAIVFGYVSVSTLTLLPAWSNHDGFRVKYTIYKNGELIKTFQYKRERFVAMWALILPFVWVNLLTSGEYDAFHSITSEFIVDLQPTVSGL